MIIKCKICGGDIQFSQGDTVGQCEYCGSTSTIPKVDEEQKLNRYNRANHFRRQNEFDKAIAAYERILEEDDTDAEAHWGVVLSRYGIEYVEDPATHRRVPTCHRVQVTSILTDEDYLAALKYAPDDESRKLYEEQAKEIADIQKRILAISGNEKPYDVFICYKETDDNGQRTRDSALAQEVYYGLTEQGYKVFFSRITLEDKLGQEYEPYIFAALKSARVMVVIGTKPEHFNAVWVKNEWSRYLALMKTDHKRLLIPCYRDMDPYDLPDELSNLQSQDMSKIGFMQDLLRGIRKVLEAGKKPEQLKSVQQEVPAAAAGLTPGINSLMERIDLFLEDGDFSSALEYINRVLDLDPKYAPAYVAKVCATFQLHRESELAEVHFLYEDNPDWQKAMRFASPQQKEIYSGYVGKVRKRVERQIRDFAYDCAMEMAVEPETDRSELEELLDLYKNSCMCLTGLKVDGSRRQCSQQNEEQFNQAIQTNDPGDVSEEQLKTASSMFASIKDKEADDRAKQCLALAEQARQKAVYMKAIQIHDANQHSPKGLETSAKLFLSIPDYQDAKKQAQRCKNEAEKIRSDLYDDAVNTMNGAGDDSGKWDEVKKKLANEELTNYRDIVQLRNQAEKRFEESTRAEQEAKQQEEERDRREEERRRQEAEHAAAKKKRITLIGSLVVVAVIGIVILIITVIVPESNYHQAEILRAEGKYAEAVKAFKNMGNYKDSETQVLATYYKEGESKREIKDWDGAIEAFTSAGNYSDALTQITETMYLKAKELAAQGDYSNALIVFGEITGYKDVDSLLATDDNLIAAVAAREAKLATYRNIGGVVTFGHYEQDNNTGNGEEEIEWIVLDIQNNRCLLLSRYGLDAKPYNTENISITWETCTLRNWLNDEFLKMAFTTEEQSAMIITNVDNSFSQGYIGWSTNDENNTLDHVFLLSYAEANKYLKVTDDNSDNIKSRVEPTVYAIQKGTYTSNSNKTTDGKSAGWWWLRSPGYFQYSADGVAYDGSLDCYFVDDTSGCVRPAFWLNLESEIF